MKILLDECIDRFAVEFPEHEVKTVPQMGWAGVKNGSLMKLAEAAFDVFITVDRNLSLPTKPPKLQYRRHSTPLGQQPLPRPRPVRPEVLVALTNIKPGSATLIS